MLAADMDSENKVLKRKVVLHTINTGIIPFSFWGKYSRSCVFIASPFKVEVIPFKMKGVGGGGNDHTDMKVFKFLNFWNSDDSDHSEHSGD